jgi:glyoxylase-like metal-dependent hydrolase (beta-lactamase superfamily II)
MPDTYTGAVTVGGPSQSRDLGGLMLTKVAVGPMDNNAYFLRCSETGDVALIDAAHSAEVLLGVLGDSRLQRIVTTHGHADHWQALPEMVTATHAPVAVHPEDAEPLPVTMFEPLVEGDTVHVGTCELSVIHLVGHTPGSIAMAYRGADRTHLFTGDALFPGGHGLTTTPEDHITLMNDLEAKVFGVFDDDTWFYPGHGGDSTIGAERPHLGEWRARGW